MCYHVGGDHARGALVTSNGVWAGVRWRVKRGLAYGVRVKRDRRLGALDVLPGLS